MKALAALLIAMSLAACNGTGSRTMHGARTYVGAGELCAKHRWMECDGTRTPAQANGGGGSGD